MEDQTTRTTSLSKHCRLHCQHGERQGRASAITCMNKRDCLLRLCALNWSNRFKVFFDGLMQSRLEKIGKTRSLLCACSLWSFRIVWICQCVTRLFCQNGNMGTKQTCGHVVSLLMPLWVCVCVWSPHNDYYGLTPISRVGSLHSWFFPFSWQRKGKQIPLRSLTETFLVPQSETQKSHTRSHTQPQTHAPMPTLWTDDDAIFEFAWYLTEGSCRGRSTIFNEDHRHVHKHKQTTVSYQGNRPLIESCCI